MPANITLPAPAELKLSEEQSVALAQIEAWLATPDSFYLLKGYAGTGKTFLMRALIARLKVKCVLTAPTNKATRVLRRLFEREKTQPECCTIYSLLGLRLEAKGELKQLSQLEKAVDLSIYGLIVIDEGSMISEQLRVYLHAAADTYGAKFLILGDPAQLPPVGETSSPIWRLRKSASELTKVMRYDSAILAFATELRNQVDTIAPNFSVRTRIDPGSKTGIWVMHGKLFEDAVKEAAKNGSFTKPDSAKVIAWRNITVDHWNRMIRGAIFGADAKKPWITGDRVIFTSPAKDLDDNLIATTDDEGTISRVTIAPHPLSPAYNVWEVLITLDSGIAVTARVLHETCQASLENELRILAEEARAKPRLWRKFWELKERFHSLRHAYAITAHRSQGSTFDEVFVDWRDIMANRAKSEAMRCLYVAATRPREKLVMN